MQPVKKDALTEKIPIIIVNAKDEVRDKVESLEIGADDYVTKPFNLSELKACIKSCSGIKKYIIRG